MIRTSKTRTGSFLLICIALVTAMVAVAFAFVNSMRTAVEIGPSSIPAHLARETARAGVAHATEVLTRDYLDRPLAPTSDASPHRIFFDPIDNTNAANPREPGSGSDNASAWNNNDLLPAAKILHPYMTFNAHEGRTYTRDNQWLDLMVSNSCPRYIEPSYWTLSQAHESDPANTTKLDFTIAPSADPAINKPLYFDAAWRPVAARADARYRLRYAVMCEDLSGHLLSSLQGAFGRDNTVLPDGDPSFLNKRGQGIEFDVTWAKRYAPVVGGFFIFTKCMATTEDINNSPLFTTSMWMGHTSNGLTNDYSLSNCSQAFTETGILKGASAWAWNTAVGQVGGVSKGSPQINATSWPNDCRPYPAKIFTWTGNVGLFYSTYGGSWFLKGGLTPYAAPSKWARSPDPETATFTDFAYNEGMTDCPWRINPLTAPMWTLRSMISAFRTPPLWEAALHYRIRYDLDKYEGGKPKWKTKPTMDPNNPTLPLVETIDPPLSSNLALPNPFRDTFKTKSRLPPHAEVAPFAQFPASRCADNPRSRTDPYYPSPIATYYPDDLGRFSHLYAGDQSCFSSTADRAIGTCAPRYDSARRNTLSFCPFDFQSDKYELNTAKMIRPNPLNPLENQLEVYFCTLPSNWNPLPGSGTPNPYIPTNQATRDLWPNAYWHDATVAMAATVAVAIAANQPPLPPPTSAVLYPPAPPSGGDATLFDGRWGSATRDTDTDGDGFNETAAAFTNVGDLDRLFLLTLGEDPDQPGNNLATKASIFAVQKGTGANFDTSPFTPTLINLPPYNPATTDYGTAPAINGTWTSQNPYDQTNAKLMNLRRTSLRNIRLNLYDNDATHSADSQVYKDEATALVKGTPVATDPKVVQKIKQLRRCRLRDAERIINDMRMSFFGSNLRYQDRTRTAHASRGRFRPLDLDGDGWAICSAYVPSEVTVPQREFAGSGTPASPGDYPMQDPTVAGKKIPYLWSEPNNWNKVVFDERPDNPGRVNDGGTMLPTGSDSYWVCFKDIDTDVVTGLSNDLATSDFKDCITYTNDDGAFPNGVSRNGFTRWFYPASPVLAAADAADGAVSDGVARVPPDTYFSLTGQFVLEKSHFYRIFSRGEVWDEWKKKLVDFAILESVFLLDPDGNVITKPNNIDPATHRVIDGAGIEDTGIILQRWGQDLFHGAKDRAGEMR